MSPIERLAIQSKVVLHEKNKEISDEPKGYAKLFHKNLVEEVRRSPDHYLEELWDWKERMMRQGRK